MLISFRITLAFETINIGDDLSRVDSFWSVFENIALPPDTLCGENSILHPM